jgi:hypothetical protein
MNLYLMRTLAYCQCPKDWDEITETFKTVFKNSPLKEQNSRPESKY